MALALASDSGTPEPRQSQREPVRVMILLLVGLALARGRYDWAANPIALRAYTLSGFFFVLLLLGCYANFRALGLSSRRGFWPALTIGAILLNLPYRWLGIDGFFYLRNHPSDYGVSKTFNPEWLGAGPLRVSWTATAALCFGFLIGAAIIWAVTRQRPSPREGTGPAGNGRARKLFLLLFLFMAVEAWMHLSNRSPYSYVPHFQAPPAKNSLYSYQALPDGLGVVNADFAYFTRLEELFQGNRPDTTVLLVRRSFMFYVSSHLSYFIGFYRSFLVLNLLLWLAATASMYAFCRDLTGSAAVAALAAGFTACGPGFIMYAAQPMAYLPGYALLAVLVYLYHRHTSKTGLAGPASIAALGITLGLTMLAYDTFAWVLFLIGYALLARVPLRRALAVVVLGSLVYAGYLFLIFRVFMFARENQNDRFIGDALAQLGELARHPQSSLFFSLLASLGQNYLQQLVQVTFYVPAALAGLALFLRDIPVRLKVVAFLLLLPSAATAAFFQFGQSYLAQFPRFSYAAYPGIILLAAVAVGRASDYFLGRGRRQTARLVWAVPLVATALLANLDAFGCMTHLYYHFYFNTGGYF